MDPVPTKMRELYRDSAGRPIPWFAFVDPETLEHDFRVMDAVKIRRAIQHQLCWVCGKRTGRHVVFVIGPMCSINRISAEPPSHRECAEWSVRNCPFLSNPDKVRREAALPDSILEPAGKMVARNPGVTLLWEPEPLSWAPFKAPNRGILFTIGTPARTEWFRRGQEATRAEVLESIETGIVLLREAAAGKPENDLLLDAMIGVAMKLVPA